MTLYVLDGLESDQGTVLVLAAHNPNNPDDRVLVAGDHRASRLPLMALAAMKDADPDGADEVLIEVEDWQIIGRVSAAKYLLGEG